MDTSVRVRYAETDAMGVAYYANYLVWFEVGRNEWFRTTGLNYRNVEANGILLPVSEVWCHYLRSARYDDEVVIRTFVTNLTPARIEFSYSLFRATDQCQLAEGKSVHAFVTPQGKPVNLRKANESLWGVLSAGLAPSSNSALG